jgi:lysophospholipase L1-like esterase
VRAKVFIASPALVVLTALLTAVLCACGRPGAQLQSRGITPTFVSPAESKLRYTGWFDRRDPEAVRFAWPGSQIRAQFGGASLRIRLTDTPHEDESRETDWITVVIDDAPPRTFALSEGFHVYPLATDLPATSHEVLIWKRTEANVGTIAFHGLTLDPGASLHVLPTAPSRRMLFIGDSITAGYGNEGADSGCRWSARTQNNYASYGAVAARKLDAEYVVAAWSGKGVTRNYEERDRVTMAALFDVTIPTESSSPRTRPGAADVVVVNLGTNDFMRGVPDAGQFRAEYAALLRSLRQRHPKALFVLALGPMLADDYPQPKSRTRMRTWLAQIRGDLHASGDTNVELIEVWSDPAHGAGCDFHPNLKTHARMGHELAQLVRDKLDW